MRRGIVLARIFQQICRNNLEFLLYCSVPFRLSSAASVQYKLPSSVITHCGIWLGFCQRFKFVRSCSHTQLPRNLQPVKDLPLPMPKEYLSLCAYYVLLCLLFPLNRKFFFIRIWLLFISNNSCPAVTAVELKYFFSLDRCPDWVICCLLCLDKFYFLHVLLFSKLQPQISVFNGAIKNPSLSASLSPITVSCGKPLEFICASCLRGSYQTRLGAVLGRGLLT